MFLGTFVCQSVCLFVCVHDNSKSNELMLLNFSYEWVLDKHFLGLYSQRFLEFFLELHLSLRKILC